jgi:hypothetical protein
LVVAGYAVVWIALQSVRDWKTLVPRLLRFGVALLPLIGVQWYINHSAVSSQVTPGGLNFTSPLTGQAHPIWNNLWNGFLHLTAIDYPVVWWLPQRVVGFLTRPGDEAPWLLGVTLAGSISLMILFIMRIRQQKTDESLGSRPAVAVAGLFVAFPLFLWACAFGGVLYIALLRYYIPLIPMALLAATALAFNNQTRFKLIGARVLHFAGTSYVALYLMMTLFSLLLLPFPGDLAAGRRDLLLGEPGRHRIGMGPDYDFSAARQYVMDLLKQKPKTILVTHIPQWFFAEPKIDRSRLHRLEKVSANHIAGPAHVVILTADPNPDGDDLIYQSTTFGNLREAHYFDSVSGLRLLRRFPEEKSKVLELNVPVGKRIKLTPNG